MTDDPALGAMIAVYREIEEGVEYLLLHRAHAGPEYEGEWAWGPPGGSREPGESTDECALRELREETGLEVPLRRIPFRDARWAVYMAEVPPHAPIRLSEEHDRLQWLAAEDALVLVSPEIIAEELRVVIDEVEPKQGQPHAPTIDPPLGVCGYAAPAPCGCGIAPSSCMSPNTSYCTQASARRPSAIR